MAPDSIDVVKQYKLMAEEAENIEFMVRDSGLLSGLMIFLKEEDKEDVRKAALETLLMFVANEDGKSIIREQSELVSVIRHGATKFSGDQKDLARNILRKLFVEAKESVEEPSQPSEPTEEEVKAAKEAEKEKAAFIQRQKDAKTFELSVPTMKTNFLSQRVSKVLVNLAGVVSFSVSTADLKATVRSSLDSSEVIEKLVESGFKNVTLIEDGTTAEAEGENTANSKPQPKPAKREALPDADYYQMSERTKRQRSAIVSADDTLEGRLSKKKKAGAAEGGISGFISRWLW
eukprot:TRINITY_DN786_c2_g1_i1.p1 TRINITY_DN786_c2_g1~~TRINITY_DN786_c2_g1_i1.p1  ORF type:complete len:290 (-),score=78.09 TRINITY_DN786_c2_g1_i1:124-993(-)